MNEENLKKIDDNSICINCGEETREDFDHFGEDVIVCCKCGWTIYKEDN